LNGSGYRGGVLANSGTGPGAGAVGSSAGFGGSGASHGGYGGIGARTITARAEAYGSSLNPVTAGSGGGGGAGATTGEGGSGGGALILNAPIVIIDGNVTVDGNDGGIDVTSGDGEGGGGAGGTVNIITDSLSGSGTISADGGDGGVSIQSAEVGGGGGGGRIAIRYNTSTFAVSNIHAFVGDTNATASEGDAGTVALIDVDENILSIKDGFSFLTHDAPINFTNITVLSPARIRSNGTTISVADTFTADDVNWTVYGPGESVLNATNWKISNSTINASDETVPLGGVYLPPTSL